MLTLEAIHFNHNTDSATGDALNIRLNHLPGTVIKSPEWRQGNDSVPVAYAREQVTQRVTIKAKMHGPPNSVFRVRARDATNFTRDKTDFWRWLALLVLRFLRFDDGGVLGEIAESFVSFGYDGDSGLVELEVRAHRIKRAGVGVYHVSWIWEHKEGSKWEPFSRTEHKIYILLNQPQKPWSNVAPGTAANDPPLAWVDALELACDWARGATNQDEVARLITKGINSNPLLFYCLASHFVDGCGSYLLSCFIGLLKLGARFPLNCDDCACAVATFSNLLGCQLRAGDINPKRGTLDTFRVLLIGGDPSSICAWQKVTGWGHHEIAWWPDLGENQYVYDSCLQLDLSKGIASVPRPHLATRMRFTDDRGRGYHNYLLSTNYKLKRNGFVRMIR